jgi:hypothetical protein
VKRNTDYNYRLITEILKRVSERNSINLSNFPSDFEITKEHLEWMVNDLLLRGYLKINELSCHSGCIESDCGSPVDDKEYSDLKFYLELTEKGRKLIS